MERSEGGAGTISKRYTVTSTQTPHGPIYQIYDRVTGATVESAYKCLKWAEREAERMESVYEEIWKKLFMTPDGQKGRFETYKYRIEAMAVIAASSQSPHDKSKNQRMDT